MAIQPQRRPNVDALRAALDERYERAHRLAEDAAADVEQASARLLAKLLRSRPQARFEALAETPPPLTPEHRAKLLASLQYADAPEPAVSVMTASRWEIWRSRLPYQAVPLTLKAVFGLGALGLTVVAWRHTGERWVSVAPGQPLPVQWRLPGGSDQAGTLDPGTRFVLIRADGQTGMVRTWVPGVGYAEASVAIQDLQNSP